MLFISFQGGYDSGFLYHCQFPPYNENCDFTEENDEPFDFRVLEDTEDNPIQTITFRWTEFQNALKKLYPVSVQVLSIMNITNF